MHQIDSVGVQRGEGVEPLKEYLTFSKDRKDIKSLNQEVAGGAFGLFQCNRIRLQAMSKAKTITSEFFLLCVHTESKSVPWGHWYGY